MGFTFGNNPTQVPSPDLNKAGVGGVIQQGRDESSAKASRIHDGLLPVALGIVGQSNERGQVQLSELSAFPFAFNSEVMPGLGFPCPGTLTRNGGWWFRAYDVAAKNGFKLQIVNKAKGSASIVKHYAGQVTFRNNSTQYRQRRDPLGNGDRGDFGDVIVMSGKVFQCTTGNKVYLQYNGNQRIPNTNQTYLDYVWQDGTLTSAAADPGGWNLATLGSTITDGGIVWTCIDASNAVGYAGGQVFSELQAGFGFDPFGLLSELREELSKFPDVVDRVVAVCNAQSDTSATAAWYQSALQSIAQFFTSRGIKVLLGLSCYNSANGTDRTTAYNTLQTGLNNALTALTGDALVYPGANLYALMGTSGPMAWANAGTAAGYLQADGTHLSGAGSYVAGPYWGDTIVYSLKNKK